MSQRIQRYLPILKKITRMGDRAQRRLIQKCDRDLIDCFSECAKNVLNGNVDPNSRQFARLKREKKDVRALARKRT